MIRKYFILLLFYSYHVFLASSIETKTSENEVIPIYDEIPEEILPITSLLQREIFNFNNPDTEHNRDIYAGNQERIQSDYIRSEDLKYKKPVHEDGADRNSDSMTGPRFIHKHSNVNPNIQESSKNSPEKTVNVTIFKVRLDDENLLNTQNQKKIIMPECDFSKPSPRCNFMSKIIPMPLKLFDDDDTKKSTNQKSQHKKPAENKKSFHRPAAIYFNENPNIQRYQNARRNAGIKINDKRNIPDDHNSETNHDFKDGKTFSPIIREMFHVMDAFENLNDVHSSPSIRDVKPKISAKHKHEKIRNFNFYINKKKLHQKLENRENSMTTEMAPITENNKTIELDNSSQASQLDTKDEISNPKIDAANTKIQEVDKNESQDNEVFQKPFYNFLQKFSNDIFKTTLEYENSIKTKDSM